MLYLQTVYCPYCRLIVSYFVLWGETYCNECKNNINEPAEDPGRKALHESRYHHADCMCKYCLYGAEALPPLEY
jgi:hypothetical protein